MYKKIKEWYENGLWSLEKVWNAVGKVITAEEYFLINGFVYPAKQ